MLTFYSRWGFRIRPGICCRYDLSDQSHKYNELFYPISDQGWSQYCVLCLQLREILCAYDENHHENKKHIPHIVRILLSLWLAPPFTLELHWHPLPWQWTFEKYTLKINGKILFQCVLCYLAVSIYLLLTSIEKAVLLYLFINFT